MCPHTHPLLADVPGAEVERARLLVLNRQQGDSPEAARRWKDSAEGSFPAPVHSPSERPWSRGQEGTRAGISPSQQWTRHTPIHAGRAFWTILVSLPALPGKPQRQRGRGRGSRLQREVAFTRMSRRRFQLRLLIY